MNEPLTPIIEEEHKPMTMNFFDALRKVQEGKMITRISWGNKDYCLMHDDRLCIFTKGEMHSWIINVADMEGEDWIVVTEPN